MADRALDVRGLMDSLRVQWRDRGKNTSRGNVNICCPFCKDDYGFHLSISEDRGGVYYCYRRPNDHSGTNPLRLIQRLGATRPDSYTLLNRYMGRVAAETVAEPPPPLSKVRARWERFDTLTDQHDDVLDYLRSRGFLRPLDVATRYDLRVAAQGKWAQRLLFPLLEDGDIIAWTGRALTSALDPKYYTEMNGRDGLVYMPRVAREVLFTVEGPMDALKGAAASESLPVATAALTGKQLNAQRLGRLRRMAGDTVKRVVMVLDADTRLAERSRMLAELKGAFPRIPVRAQALPTPFKDLGEMGIRDAAAFLQSHAQ